VRLRLLGAFALERAGRAVELPMSSQRLLAFLALQRRPVLRVFAAGSLWLDAAEDRAGACLRSVLWRLQLPDHGLVDVSNNHLALAPGVEVDLSRSLGLAQRVLTSSAELDDLEQAPEELSIDLLPYWYEDWVLVERERFRQLRLHALEALCEQLTALGRFDHAVEAGIAAVAGRAAARERAPGPDPGAPDGGELRGGRAAVPVLS